MNFEEKKTTYKEVTENSDASSKKFEVEIEKNKLRRRLNVIEKSESESKKVRRDRRQILGLAMRILFVCPSVCQMPGL